MLKDIKVGDYIVLFNGEVILISDVIHLTDGISRLFFSNPVSVLRGCVYFYKLYNTLEDAVGRQEIAAIIRGP